jgi:hypothetical protein
MWRKNIVVEDGSTWELRPELVRLIQHHFPDVPINAWPDLAPLRRNEFGISLYRTQRRESGFEYGIRVELPTGTDLDTEVKVQALLEQFCSEHPGTRLTS